MKVINPEFYIYTENWVNTYISPAIKGVPYNLVREEIEKIGVGTGIYFVPIFNQNFCDSVLQIVKNLPEHKWNTARHLSYPTTDIELHELGLDELYGQVLRDFMIPLALEAYGIEGDDTENFYVENFLAKYTPNKQNHLPMHNDSSLFTFNLSLNEDFEGGGILFEKHNITVQPSPGAAILNPGMMGCKHGAKPVVSGTRYMLISFVLQKNPYNRKW